jgi:hypothetical protein
MKVISGGQTGADRAALDAAIDLGLEYGGSVPKGRLAEDGVVDETRYPHLTELGTASYTARTRRNVMDADATLAFTDGPLFGGTAETVRIAIARKKPHLVVDLQELKERDAVKAIRKWLAELKPAVLNVAGPRESVAPGIYGKVYRVLKEALRKKRRRSSRKMTRKQA